MTIETATYTPGPWAQSGQTIRSDSGVNIARTAFDCAADQSEDAQWHGGGPLEPEAAANAALIAAAPDLLKALDSLLGSFGWMFDAMENTHYKCDISDTECRDWDGGGTDHEEIRDAHALLKVIRAHGFPELCETIAQARGETCA